MIKIIGLILIFASCNLYSYCIVKNEKDKYLILKEFKYLFSIMKSDIDYGITTFDIAIMNLESRTQLLDIKKFLKSLLENIRGNIDGSLNDIWSKLVDESKFKNKLDKVDIVEIKKVGNCLGYLDKKMQLANMEYIVNYLSNRVVSVKENYLNKNKLYIKLGVMVSILMVVVLL